MIHYIGSHYNKRDYNLFYSGDIILMPPVHNEVSSRFVVKKNKVKLKYLLLLYCFFFVSAAWGVPENSSPEPKTNKDILLEGVPQGWNAHVIGVGKARQPVPFPLRPKKQKDSGNLLPPKEGLQTGDFSAQKPSKNRILLPISADMGIAAYLSGGVFVLVIDNMHPMDASSLQGDGIFSKLSVSALSEATIITVPIPDTRRLFLSQQSEGWVLGDRPPPDGSYDLRREIIPKITSDGLLLPMRKPGRIFSINDPVSHQKLLIATSSLDDGGILSFHHGDSYDLWPTLEGVVVSDHTPEQAVEMRRTYDGVILSINGKTIPDLDKVVYANDVDAKWLGLRYLSEQDAESRYKEALIAAADSSPQDRFQKRFEAAQAAFNAGDFLAARSIMTVALDDDPEEVLRHDVRFFIGANALLNGDFNVANLLDAQWPEDDLRATQLWKGFYYAVVGKKNVEGAHLLANDFQRLLGYPAILRSLLLPIASEQIARYGTLHDMDVLDQIPESPAFLLARALRDLRIGKTDQAGKVLSSLSNSQDVLLSEKAHEAKLSLDFSKGRVKPQEAIEQFGLLIPDARLARREALVLMLQAEAAIRANQWEKALSALDEGDSLSTQKYNDRYIPMLHQALANIVKIPSDLENIPSEQKGNLLHKTAILHAHLPKLPPGPEKAQLLVIYGRLLSALGLQKEASEAYSIAIPMIEDTADKAEATNLLATSYMKQKDFDNATHLLVNSNNASLSKEDIAKKNRLIAQIAIASGKPEVGLYLLNGDDDLLAADMRAKVHEDRNEWALAVPDVHKMVEAMVPDEGALTQKQQLLVLRLASDASRAKDSQVLNWLVKKVDNRSFDNDDGHIFKLLVSP